jgi:hypothetical protein
VSGGCQPIARLMGISNDGVVRAIMADAGSVATSTTVCAMPRTTGEQCVTRRGNDRRCTRHLTGCSLQFPGSCASSKRRFT